jgi:anti-anti-sigma factor
MTPSWPSSCRLHVSTSHGRTISATLDGEVDVASRRWLRPVLKSLMQPEWDVELLLDDVTFIDVAGVRLLVELAATADSRECGLLISGGRSEVLRVFELTNAASMLPLIQTEPPHGATAP